MEALSLDLKALRARVEALEGQLATAWIEAKVAEAMSVARALAIEEAKNAFRLLRASFPEAVGTDWESIARELTALAPLPPALVVLPVGDAQRVMKLIREHIDMDAVADDAGESVNVLFTAITGLKP